MAVPERSAVSFTFQKTSRPPKVGSGKEEDKDFVSSLEDNRINR